MGPVPARNPLSHLRDNIRYLHGSYRHAQNPKREAFCFIIGSTLPTSFISLYVSIYLVEVI